MFLCGKSDSAWSRATYLLVVLSLVTVPVHFAVNQHHLLQAVLNAGSAAVFVCGVLVFALRRPRDPLLAACALFAWIVHVGVTPL